MEQQFEHKGLEADIERLKAEVAEHLRKPEVQRGEVSHRDVVKEMIRPMIYESTQNHKAEEIREAIFPDYARSFPAETKLKVEQLIDLALHKGIANAAAEARKTGDPATMDLFHDAITTKLFDEFVKLGILMK
jgi:tyrosyl-tRNA synthetase